jgi:hypothetical protein
MWIGYFVAILAAVAEMIEIALNPGLLKQINPVGFYVLFYLAGWPTGSSASIGFMTF